MRSRVSILILLEIALEGVLTLSLLAMLQPVSILILLEIALEGRNAHKKQYRLLFVSILILLEIALEVTNITTAVTFYSSFNPYSAGNCSGRPPLFHNQLALARFNPYSAGNCSGSCGSCQKVPSSE